MPKTVESRVVAITNQKGGVGKTTTAVNLAASLAEIGMKVLVVDMDPQGNASTGLGIYADDREHTTYDLLLSDISAEKAVLSTSTADLDIIPSTTDLSSADLELVSSERKVYLLKDALHEMSKIASYDFILIDCPPSLNILTINAMVAAQSIIVPLQSEFFALEGLSQLLLSLREVREAANPSLRIDGIVMTMYDSRNRLSKQVEDDARANLGDLVFETVIPRNVRLSEAPSHAVSILDYDSASAGSRAYRALALEYLARIGL